MICKGWRRWARTAGSEGRFLWGVAAGALALAIVGLTPSVALADNAPTIVFSGPTSPVTTSSVTFSYTINRGGKQDGSLTCSLSGPVTSTDCGNVVTVQHSTTATVELTGLTDGTYTYAVDLVLGNAPRSSNPTGRTDGGGTSASTTFTVNTSPKLAITPASHSFGTTSSPVLVGGTPDQETFLVENTGGPTSGAPSVELGANASQWKVVSNGCTSSALATNASCTVAVEFAPTVAGFTTNSSGVVVASYTSITDSATLGASADGASASASLTGIANWGCMSFSHMSYSGCNLSAAGLSNADLSNADLSGADLSGAILLGANLSNADLSGADLSNAFLGGANLSNADLSNADLSNAILLTANLTGADLTGVTWNNTICPDNTNSNNEGDTCVGHLS